MQHALIASCRNHWRSFVELSTTRKTANNGFVEDVRTRKRGMDRQHSHGYHCLVHPLPLPLSVFSLPPSPSQHIRMCGLVSRPGRYFLYLPLPPNTYETVPGLLVNSFLTHVSDHPGSCQSTTTKSSRNSALRLNALRETVKGRGETESWSQRTECRRIAS
jgi:hypothetical protein